MKAQLNWDEYFMGMAVLSSLRSKDPSTKVGAVIVNDEKKVVSIGYNGMPRHIDDDDLTWNKGEGLDSDQISGPMNITLSLKSFWSVLAFVESTA